jgi:transposase
MRQVGEVLRLKAEGLSLRQISRSLGIGSTTVHEYLWRARAAGLEWPLPAGTGSEELEARLFRLEESGPHTTRPEPNWQEVHRELRRGRHVTLRLLWLEYRQAQPEGWGYTQFCVRYRRWQGHQDVVMRQEHPAGERAFVDFCGDTVPVTEEATGEVFEAQIFVAVLGASGYLYAEAVRRQDLESWLGVHVRALEFFGGVPRTLVPDNLKAGVTRACWYDPELNPSYLELARHYQTAVLPTRPRHPRDKAAVEVGVQVVERWVLAPLRKRRYFALAQLNADIAEQVAEVNGRPFRGLNISRRDLFVDLERPALRALPERRYEFATWRKAKVNIDYHVEFDLNYYSVPYRLVHEQVEVRATATTVEIFRNHQRVASHVRSHGRRRFITCPEHRPASHRAHLEWTPSRLLGWAAGISAEVEKVVDTILRTRPHPEQGYRACLGLMRLAKRYDPERLTAACERALALGSPSYRTVESILKTGQDRQPLPDTRPAATTPLAHENVRGAEYYRVEA